MGDLNCNLLKPEAPDCKVLVFVSDQIKKDDALHPAISIVQTILIQKG